MNHTDYSKLIKVIGFDGIIMYEGYSTFIALKTYNLSDNCKLLFGEIEVDSKGK